MTRTLGTVTITAPVTSRTSRTRPARHRVVRIDPEGDGPGMFRVLYESFVYNAPGFDPWQRSWYRRASPAGRPRPGADGNYGTGDGTSPELHRTTDP